MVDYLSDLLGDVS